MPVPNDATIPKESTIKPIPADVYNVAVEDIEEEIKPAPDSWKKNEDGSTEMVTQYKVKLIVMDGEFADRTVNCWIRASLRSSTKSKHPTLPQFIQALTGTLYGPDDIGKVNGKFLNSLISLPMRITTSVEKAKTGDREFCEVKSFLPMKK